MLTAILSCALMVSAGSVLVPPEPSTPEEAPGVPRLPEDLPSALRYEQGVFLPKELAIATDAWIEYMSDVYPDLCQRKIWDCDATCKDRLLIQEEELDTPWWYPVFWIAGGTAVGFVSAVVLLR